MNRPCAVLVKFKIFFSDEAVRKAFTNHQHVFKDDIIVDFLVPILVSNGVLNQVEGETLEEAKPQEGRILLLKLLNMDEITGKDLIKFRKALVETGQPHLAKLLLEPSKIIIIINHIKPV